MSRVSVIESRLSTDLKAAGSAVESVLSNGSFGTRNAEAVQVETSDPSLAWTRPSRPNRARSLHPAPIIAGMLGLIIAAVVTVTIYRGDRPSGNDLTVVRTNGGKLDSVLSPSTTERGYVVTRYSAQIADGSIPCISLSTSAGLRATCISIPGTQFWLIDGQLVVLARSQIRLSDGGVVAAAYDGVAFDRLPDGASLTEGVVGCDPSALAAAIAKYPASPGSAWMLVRCAPGRAAVVEFNYPEQGVGYLKLDSQAWRLIGTSADGTPCPRDNPEISGVCAAVGL